MNQRGFFTIMGLCLLMVAAISIKGVHEFETNYSRGIENYQAEHKLQNLADSALIEAAENFNSTEKNIKIKIRQNNLGDIDNLKNVSVEVWGMYSDIHIKNGDDTNIENLPQDTVGTVIISVASCDSPFIIGKIYRRSLAYILDDDAEKTIHFMN